MSGNSTLPAAASPSDESAQSHDKTWNSCTRDWAGDSSGLNREAQR